MGRRRRRKSKSNDLITLIIFILICLFILEPALIVLIFLLVLCFILLSAFYKILSKLSSITLGSGNRTKFPSSSVKINEGVEYDSYPSYKSSFQDEVVKSNTDKTKWSLNLIKTLEWKRFEELCSAYFEEEGYRSEVTRLGADGGVDIRLYKDSHSLSSPMGVVQCKAWNTYKVGVKPVRELFGVMHAEKATLGVFVTSGEFTKEAIKFSQDKNMVLFTGELLLKEILNLPEENQARLLEEITRGDYITPSCPSCGVKMTLRTSKKGKNVGNQFWGCPKYPRCRSTLQIKAK